MGGRHGVVLGVLVFSKGKGKGKGLWSVRVGIVLPKTTKQCRHFLVSYDSIRECGMRSSTYHSCEDQKERP
jgi:hypothetical protein